MQYIVPDYYDEFSCIKGECKHNCCIGWEIDIDSDTAELYKSVTGDFGKRLYKSVSNDDVPHFILGKDERCPFLNSENLCDIILELGEECLCDICAEHPRFTNEFDDRIEKGLGLCCEAAARLILSREKPVVLLGDTGTDDEIILLRDRIISALQQREKSILKRLGEALSLCGKPKTEYDIEKWTEKLLSLERLDDEWADRLNLLKNGIKTANFADFDLYMDSRQTEYEQLAVYLVYRHFANTDKIEAATTRLRFAEFAVMLIRAIGAVTWTENEKFSTDDYIEIARMFSSEIEYSDENLGLILEWLK